MSYYSRIRHLAWGITALIVLFSCERRPLGDEVPYSALIPVKVYWDVAGISAQNASILVYKSDGNLYKEKSFAGSDDSYAETDIELEIGTYTVLVFNEKRNQIDHILMQGHEHLSSFEALVTPASSVYSTLNRAAGDLLVNQPGHLAVWKGKLTVTIDMISRSRSRSKSKTRTSDTETRTLDDAINSLTDLHPPRKTAVANLKAHISGINYARMPALVELRNMAQGYHFETDRNTLVPVTVQFKMNNRKYDPGSYTDGSIHESVVTFGLPGNRTAVENLPKPIFLDFNFKLVDVGQTQEYRSYDVTDKVLINNLQRISININIDFPNPIPPVEPEGGTGMDAEVIEWEGEVIGIELGKKNG